MYNRYIPQPDGSFRRNRVPDQSRQAPPRRSAQDTCPPPSAPPCPTPTPPPQPRQENRCQKQESTHCDSSIGSFLRQLLPRSLDTSDLLIIMLLLLMAGDCPEDQNTALLTLAIYLFL